MSDIVLDENGNEIDETGTGKKSYNAETMKSGELAAIISGFKSEFDIAFRELDKTLAGASYSAGADALTKLISVCSAGPHIEFAKKNSWMANRTERDKFFTSGGSLGIEEKNKMVYFQQMVQASAGFRGDFTKFISSCVSDSLFSAYKAIRFESQMQDMVKAGDIDCITQAFAEFDNIYNTYNNGKIFDSVPVSKSRYSLEENTEIILNDMDAAIIGKSNLSKFLLSSKKNSPAGMNTLYVFDRETRQFNVFADRADAMKRTIDACVELNAKLSACYAYGTDSLFAYLDGFQRVMDKITAVCQRALDAIDAFRTQKSNAPYAIMHYAALVKDCVNKHMLGSLSDPMSEGTNYSEVAQTMIRRLQALAKNVAKCAPN